MSYKALLFCPDEKIARVVTQVLNEVDFKVEPCNEPFAAVKKLMAEHFDAIVVDCENEQNAALLFKSAHNSGSNNSSLAVAVVEGQAGVAKAFRIGANLVLTKPINVEQSKGTLRVARGLLRKNEGTKPASAAPAAPAPPRPAATGNSPGNQILSQTPVTKPATAPFPQPSLGPSIPPPNSALFDVEDEPEPKLEPTEAALLESMPDPQGNKIHAHEPAHPAPASKEYPWQPMPKPVAGPMATALQRAAEATGQSEMDSLIVNPVPEAPTPVPDTTTSRPFAASTSSGHAAAVAPARISQKPVEQPPHLDAPTFSSLGDTATEPAERSKKPIIIAAAILVAGIIGYVGWTKMHGAPAAQSPAAPTQTTPARAQQSVPNEAPAASSAQATLPVSVTSQPSTVSSPLPVEHAPDITLSTADAHPSATKKTTSVVAPNTVVHNPAETKTQAPEPIVVKNETFHAVPVRSATEDAAQPPALESFDATSNNQNQALSGIVSTTAVNLPKPAQKLKVSQGVSQGLLIKSVPPEYPPQAMKMHIQGAVELLAYIGKDGSITGVKPIKGDANLARAAVDAVKQWKYKPYYLNDQPVEIQTQITVNFKLP